MAGYAPEKGTANQVLIKQQSTYYTKTGREGGRDGGRDGGREGGKK